MVESPTLDATSYIQHHLTFLSHKIGDGGAFWTIHSDTVVTSLLIGALAFGFLRAVTRRATAAVPGRLQAFVEVCLEFVDKQVQIYANVFHLDEWRDVATADLNTTFPLALSVFGLMIFFTIRRRGWAGWARDLVSRPFGISRYGPRRCWQRSTCCST